MFYQNKFKIELSKDIEYYKVYQMHILFGWCLDRVFNTLAESELYVSTKNNQKTEILFI